MHGRLRDTGKEGIGVGGGFRISTRLDGALRGSGTGGRKVSAAIRKVLDDEVVRLAAAEVSLSADEISERNLYAAAVFFQRVVSRTPLDEDYVHGGKTHRADGDAVRDFWAASHGRSRITAGEMRESYGISFIKFNDPAEIDTIHMIFRSYFKERRRIVRSINIQNDHERFVELEYGGYGGNPTVPKQGEHYEHGIINRHSVQAPFGMLRVTQAEFKDIVLKSKSGMLVRGYSQRSQRLSKVPGGSKMKRLAALIQNRTHLSEDDIDEVVSLTG